MRVASVRDPVPDDGLKLSINLREADAQELDASSPRSHIETIERCIKQSDLLWSVDVDGELAGMFGVVPESLLGSEGIPWMLCTKVADRWSPDYIRGALEYMPKILSRYRYLSNYVDSRNAKHIRWIKRLGFTVHPPEPNWSGIPFHFFELDLR